MNNIKTKSSNLNPNKRPRNTQSEEEINSIKKQKYNETSSTSDKNNQNNINTINLSLNNNFNISKQVIDKKQFKNLGQSKKNRNNKKQNLRIKFHPKNTKFVKKLKTLLQETNKNLNKSIPSLSDDDFLEFLKKNINNSNLHKDSNFLKMIRESNISLPGAGVQALKSCVICFDEIDFETKHYLRCGHVFHKDCIKKWGRQDESDGTCPVCKQDIDSDSSNEDEVFSEDNQNEEDSLSEISFEEPRQSNHAHYLYIIERNIHYTIWVIIIIIFIYSILGLHLIKNISSR